VNKKSKLPKKRAVTTETPMTIPVKRIVCWRLGQSTLESSLLTSFKKTTGLKPEAETLGGLAIFIGPNDIIKMAVISRRRFFFTQSKNLNKDAKIDQMGKIGPEAESEPMRLAADHLLAVMELVDRGEVGLFVKMPKAQAALAFRLPYRVWDKLETTGRGLEISVPKGEVWLELSPSLDERIEHYQWLLGVIQLSQRAPQDVLAALEIPDYLKNKFPGLAETIEIIKTSGSCLPEEESALLHFYLYVLYGALEEKAQLTHPRYAFGFL